MDDLLELQLEKIMHGVCYLMNISATTESLQIEVEEKSSGDSWSGTFNSAYIEEISQMTGNFKRYNVFIKMLTLALQQQTDSVCIDILTYADLENLKKRSKNTIPVQSNKRYFILSYIVEFDKVHYPLPLNFQENPNVNSLKQSVVKLRKENESLREQNSKLQSQIEIRKVERNPADLIIEQEQSKEIDYLKQLLDQKDRELLEQKNLYQQQISQMVRKSDHQELKQKYFQSEQQQIDINKKINELEQYLSAVLDENTTLKQQDKKLKSRIQTLEQELQSALQRSTKKLVQVKNVSRSPSLNKQKQSTIKRDKITPIRQRKTSMDSDNESSFRKKKLQSSPSNSNQKIRQSPIRRTIQDSPKSTTSSRTSKSFKKTTNQPQPEEQRLLEKLQQLRERNKENSLTSTPSLQSEDLLSIDDRLGKLTSLLKKVKNA